MNKRNVLFTVFSVFRITGPSALCVPYNIVLLGNTGHALLDVWWGYDIHIKVLFGLFDFYLERTHARPWQWSLFLGEIALFSNHITPVWIWYRRLWETIELELDSAFNDEWQLN